MKVVDGLYFAPDSVDFTDIGALGLNKCGEVSIKCINKVLEAELIKKEKE